MKITVSSTSRPVAKTPLALDNNRGTRAVSLDGSIRSVAAAAGLSTPVPAIRPPNCWDNAVKRS